MDIRKIDNLTVKTCGTREEMGRAAAADIHGAIVELLLKKDSINIIFAAAPSQNETLAALLEYSDIEWGRVRAFHMDEYVGLPCDAPQRFSAYLDEHIFGRVKFLSVNYIDPTADAERVCERYSELLRDYPPDIVVLGIGENGHIAFNDPPVCDFKDKRAVKVVELDPICRRQQVNDGCFASLDEVPTHAVTLTVPTLISAPLMFCSVPGKTKAWAVEQTLTAEISEACPSTILRLHPGATLYLDEGSARR